MRRVAARKADLSGVFSHHAVNRAGVHAPRRIERLHVAAKRTKQGRALLAAVAGNVEIGADALCRLRVDRQGFAPVARRDPKGEDPLHRIRGIPFGGFVPHLLSIGDGSERRARDGSYFR
jgi:hypothetical protein